MLPSCLSIRPIPRGTFTLQLNRPLAYLICRRHIHTCHQFLPKPLLSASTDRKHQKLKFGQIVGVWGGSGVGGEGWGEGWELSDMQGV